MNPWLRFACVALWLCSLFPSSPLLAQGDPLAQHRMNGLKGLPAVAIVIRPNMNKEVMSVPELGDLLNVALNRDLADLKTTSTQKALAWLELSVTTAPEGGVVELSVYRWARIAGANEDVFTKVWWDSRLLLRGVDRGILREVLESLVTKFSADVLRARR